MRTLLPLVLFAAPACTGGASKQDAARVFTAATTQMASAQSRAVSAAHGAAALIAPAALQLQYSGSCTNGGTVAVNGSYDDSGNGMAAAFDLETSFSGCKEVTGTLDGDLHWTSNADANGFTSAMTGSLTWTNGQDNATCDLDLHLAVGLTAGVTYSGTVCGYNVQELGH
jgi:hypothetical protein